MAEGDIGAWGTVLPEEVERRNVEEKLPLGRDLESVRRTECFLENWPGKGFRESKQFIVGESDRSRSEA